VKERHGPGGRRGSKEETVTVTTHDGERDAAPRVPATEAETDIPAADEIDAMREEIDRLDADILRLIKRRSEVSQRIGRARMAAGGPRIVYNREMAVLARFRELGTEGRELGMILLRLGRGRLGGR
jgi:chorismate mutase